MPLFETIRQVLTPPISYPMVTLFPGGPIGNDVGLNPAAAPDGGAVPEPQVQADGQIGRSADGKPPAHLPNSPSAPDTSLRGAVGTANFAGFIRDLGEYNATLEGRNAFLIYEKMRRSARILAVRPSAARPYRRYLGLGNSTPARLRGGIQSHIVSDRPPGEQSYHRIACLRRNDLANCFKPTHRFFISDWQSVMAIAQ